MNAATLPSGFGGIRRVERWYDPGIDGGGDVPLVIVPTVATVAQQIGAQGEQLPAYQQVSTAQTWFAPDADVERQPLLVSAPPTPFFADQDPVVYPSTQPTWFAPDASAEGFVPILPPFNPATVVTPQQPDPSESVNLWPTWYHPGNDPVDGRYEAEAAQGTFDTTVLALSPDAYFPLTEPKYSSYPGSPQAAEWGTSYDKASVFREGTWRGGFTNGRLPLIAGETLPSINAGGTGWLEVPNASWSINPGVGDFTVVAWVRGFSAGTFCAQIDDSGTDSGWSLGGSPPGLVVSEATLQDIAQGVSRVEDGFIHMVVGRRSGGLVSVFVDGGGPVSVPSTPRNVTNTAPFFIGKRSNAVPSLYNGDIGRVMVIQSGLTDAQIANLWLAGTGNTPWAAALMQRPDWSEERDRQPVWFAPDAGVEPPAVVGNAPPVAYFAPSQDPQQEVWLPPTWNPASLDEVDGPLPPPVAAGTVATVPQQAGLWQEGEQQQQWLPSLWFQDADLLGVASFDQFDPSVGFDWSEQPQAWRDIVWFLPEPPAEPHVPISNAPPPAFFAPLDDRTQDTPTDQRWFLIEASADGFVPIPATTTATVAQQAALFGDESGQQTIPTTAAWFDPLLAIGDAPVAAVITTVGGIPTILIDAEDGTVYVYIGGNFILVASPKAG